MYSNFILYLKPEKESTGTSSFFMSCLRNLKKKKEKILSF